MSESPLQTQREKGRRPLRQVGRGSHGAREERGGGQHAVPTPSHRGPTRPARSLTSGLEFRPFLGRGNQARFSAEANPPVCTGASNMFQGSGDTTPCRITGVTLHSHVNYNSGHPTRGCIPRREGFELPRRAGGRQHTARAKVSLRLPCVALRRRVDVLHLRRPCAAVPALQASHGSVSTPPHARPLETQSKVIF